MKLTTLDTGKLHFRLTGLLLATIACVSVAISANGLSTAEPSQEYVVQHSAPDELQIQLDGNGFTPGEVQHAAGTFAIAVENSNIEGEYTLKLKAADGTILKEVPVQKGSAAFTVTLSSGEYTLTEASHGQWLCRITVQ